MQVYRRRCHMRWLIFIALLCVNLGTSGQSLGGDQISQDGKVTGEREPTNVPTGSFVAIGRIVTSYVIEANQSERRWARACYSDVRIDSVLRGDCDSLTIGMISRNSAWWDETGVFRTRASSSGHWLLPGDHVIVSSSRKVECRQVGTVDSLGAFPIIDQVLFMPDDGRQTSHMLRQAAWHVRNNSTASAHEHYKSLIEREFEDAGFDLQQLGRFIMTGRME